MSNLIRRLETASEGSRELDAEINFTLGLGMTRCNYDESSWHGGCDSPGCGGWVGIFDDRRSYPNDWRDDPVLLPYTTSIDAAMTLVPDGWLWAVGTMERGVFARLCIAQTDGSYSGGAIDVTAATAPLALCAASLKAREAGDE